LTGTVRADVFLKSNLPGFSRRVIEEFFTRRGVRLNGCPATKGNRVSAGDLLEVELPEPAGPFPQPVKPPGVSVAFEDQALLVVDKPGLLPTHPLGPFETGTLVNTLVGHWPQIAGLGTKPLEPGLVHRLDSGTSGLLAVALIPEAWSQLKKDLAAKRWEKTYRVLVEGLFTEPGRISLPLAHHPADRRKMKVIRSSGDSRRGRVYQAVTEVRPLMTFKDHTLLEVRLLTGVTHQIRAHLSFLGHPVVGDTLYGAKVAEALGLPAGRFFLHSFRLSLPHPLTRQPIICTAPWPEDLQKVLSLIDL
jgi:23S rRNA pseudouridine1911/1915/1917 synthase